QLVLPDWPADRSAEAVLVQPLPVADALALVAGVQSIQVAIAKVLVDRAVQLIGSGLRNHIESSARAVSELRRHHVLNQGELAGCFVGNDGDRSGDITPVVIHAVDYEVIVGGPLPANGRTDSIAHAARGGYAGAEQGEVDRAEVVEAGDVTGHV